MGLDMYLERMPRMDGVTSFNVVAYDGWIDYMDYMQKPLKPNETDKYTFAEWVGESVAKNLPNSDVREELSNFAKTNYYYWDDRHEYPHKTVVEQVGYWRKENAIHNWFVENVQNGVDDCSYHDEVTANHINTLINICKTVLLTKDRSIAEKLLPTESGFFFGSTDYDEWYFDGLEHTIEMLEKVLEETDFEKYAIYYCSSW